MKRSFNFTNRQKIIKEWIQLSLEFDRETNEPVAFTLLNLKLGSLKLKPDDKIYVEAYYRTELQRFYCGTIGNPNIPYKGNLDGLLHRRNLKFRIYVVRPDTKKIVAHANKIKPQFDSLKESILPVDFRALDNQVWKVEFEDDDGGPILVLNANIPHIQYLAQKDPRFFFEVYPNVLKEILFYMLLIEKKDFSMAEEEWPVKWMRYLEGIGVEVPENIQEMDDKEKYQWILDGVERFCNFFEERFEELKESLEYGAWPS